MSKIEVKNVEGKAAGEVELSSDVFGIEPNIPVVHQVVVAYEASLRQGTHSVKNRHEVSGGGVKPWRQKGTGRARQGSIRAGQWVGGGVIFEARKTKQAVALLSALALDGKRVTVVVDDEDINTYLAFRNLPKVNVIGVSESNTRNLLDNGALVMSTAVAKQLEEVLA